MHDAGRMRRLEGVGQGDAHVDERHDVERSLRGALQRRLALQQLHDQEDAAVAGLTDVVKRADVGVLQRGHGPRLAQEPLARRRVAGQGGGQHLDRHIALETRVARPVDLPHAAGANGADDFVRPEPSAGGDSHRCQEILWARPPLGAGQLCGRRAALWS